MKLYSHSVTAALKWKPCNDTDATGPLMMHCISAFFLLK